MGELSGGASGVARRVGGRPHAGQQLLQYDAAKAVERPAQRGAPTGGRARKHV